MALASSNTFSMYSMLPNAVLALRRNNDNPTTGTGTGGAAAAGLWSAAVPAGCGAVANPRSTSPKITRLHAQNGTHGSLAGAGTPGPCRSCASAATSAGVSASLRFRSVSRFFVVPTAIR
ncbi:hypothetical protein Vretimale_3359 [Volvox reticuliferus]|uniref:Uncharacterized protein n=1 Tax=Volvox reticuliferus TaxID=1737510 RepID=A0A8J4FD86_9CHLO|nr:hypothetical protein Vretifemale_931 [Volvox reticuliferus]GIL97812.1 hypothetical protein Vretimale_3359 [Volvox reticuliferus]